MYKTEGNLQAAFSGESQTYCRYVQFAAKADAEGFPEAAILFRAAAEAEMVHIRNHFAVMGGVGSTKDNLLAAVTSEDKDIHQVYPGFIDKAGEEQNERAQRSFDYACKADKIHHDKFEKAFETARVGQRISNDSYFVCRICGNIATGQAPPKCGICGNEAGSFNPVD